MYSYEEDRKEYIYGYIISELCYMDTRQFDYIKRNVRKSKIREKLFDLINSDMDSKQRALYFENFSLNLQELSSLRKKKIIKKMEYFLCLDGKFDEQDRNILSRVALQDYQFDSNRIQKRLNKIRKKQNKNVNINIKDTTIRTKKKMDAVFEQSIEVSNYLKNLIVQRENLFEEYNNKIQEDIKALEKIDDCIPTVALLGRTKAGKSTIFSALSHKCPEFIGNGKQRTSKVVVGTYIDGIRFVDTPGLDAAIQKGRIDEKRAFEVTHYADYVCIVVSNDTIGNKVENCIKGLVNNGMPLLIVTNNKGIEFSEEDDIQTFIKSSGKAAKKENNYLKNEITELDVLQCSIWAKGFGYYSLRKKYRKANKMKLKSKLLIAFNRRKILIYSGLPDFVKKVKDIVVSNQEAYRKKLLERAANKYIKETNKFVSDINDYIEQQKKKYSEEIKRLDECLEEIKESINQYFQNYFFEKYDDVELQNRFGKLSRKKFENEVQKFMQEILDLNGFEEQIKNIIKKFRFTKAPPILKIDICLQESEKLEKKKLIYGSDVKQVLKYAKVGVKVMKIFFPALNFMDLFEIGENIVEQIPMKDRLEETERIGRERCEKIKQIIRKSVDCNIDCYDKEFSEKKVELGEEFNKSINTDVVKLKLDVFKDKINKLKEAIK